MMNDFLFFTMVAVGLFGLVFIILAVIDAFTEINHYLADVFDENNPHHWDH